jgi:hypothetical protein
LNRILVQEAAAVKHALNVFQKVHARQIGAGRSGMRNHKIKRDGRKIMPRGL